MYFFIYIRITKVKQLYNHNLIKFKLPASTYSRRKKETVKNIMKLHLKETILIYCKLSKMQRRDTEHNRMNIEK